ncbi:MAG: hypothetical protein LKF87_04015 [Clostridium tyrobutyricum]|uniref:hypothetical protein n=1 Tax=Clostridium tyrobutyricum TaxID=1519 RepID=UPI0024323A7A|nr:hypothetical protein [Clostridium tyrobutyricum]MCH4199230.1 hypothetical protein [Clostridium tyrobutyricum]MCH4236562.1 hypothetical protein [Clostridium tyrobutyricum]MCH4258122.1 hypothetical protein [Clostridium tyrobutyricum]MCI1239161.1 hypothetical protein [Clostridium tyrobutyricum]MCI1651367.1 hypothetical protein [Clostridium tyrobutyricum]
MDLFNNKKLLALEKEIFNLKSELNKLKSNKEEIEYLDLKTELSKLDNEIKIKKDYIKSLDYAIELKTKRSRELKGNLDRIELKMKKKLR